MSSNMIFSIVMVASILGSYYYQKYITNKYLKELLKYKKNRDKKRYMSLLESIPVKLYFSPKRIFILKLRFYIEVDNLQQIKNLYRKLLESDRKFKEEDKILILMQTYYYFAENQHKNIAIENYNILGQKIYNTKYQYLDAEIKEVKEVFINHDINYAEILKNKIKNSIDCDEKYIMYYRLSKLYYFLNDFSKANSYLERANSFLSY